MLVACASCACAFDQQNANAFASAPAGAGADAGAGATVTVVDVSVTAAVTVDGGADPLAALSVDQLTTSDRVANDAAAAAATAAVAGAGAGASASAGAAPAAATSDVYLPEYDAADPSLHPVVAAPGDMTRKLARFVAHQRALHRAGDASALPTPYLVVDTDVVRDYYAALRQLLPDTAHVFYAVKANPAAEVLRLLYGMGSSFDAASKGEIDLLLGLGVAPARISFGNTIKSERAIAYAHAQGISLFAFDSIEELHKLARSAPGARVFARVLMLCEGAEWPLSRKFGCSLDMAVQLLLQARALGLVPYGMSFHVGSQQTRLQSWDDALRQLSGAYVALQQQHGLTLQLLNLGGGFPARYQRDVPSLNRYADALKDAVSAHFGTFNANPNATAAAAAADGTSAPHVPVQLIVEPGRSIVGDSGVIDTEVLLIANKTLTHDVAAGDRSWVYLDAGRFGGLPETQDESIKYRLQVPARCSRTDLMTVALAGPSCDSADILYERARYLLPRDLAVGDRISILSTGAYTLTYSAIGFNGFAPLHCVCI